MDSRSRASTSTPAGPRQPLSDLAAAAWASVPLVPDTQLQQAGFDPLPDLGARLRPFLDAYRLTPRKAILPALTDAILENTQNVRHWHLDAAGAVGALDYLADKLRRLHTIQPTLQQAL